MQHHRPHAKAGVHRSNEYPCYVGVPGRGGIRRLRVPAKPACDQYRAEDRSVGGSHGDERGVREEFAVAAVAGVFQAVARRLGAAILGDGAERRHPVERASGQCRQLGPVGLRQPSDRCVWLVSGRNVGTERRNVFRREFEDGVIRLGPGRPDRAPVEILALEPRERRKDEPIVERDFEFDASIPIVDHGSPPLSPVIVRPFDCSLVFLLQDGHEGFLGDVDGADGLHALLGFLLFLEELALSAAVAAVAFGGDVFADGLDGLSRDDCAVVSSTKEKARSNLPIRRFGFIGRLTHVLLDLF